MTKKETKKAFLISQDERGLHITLEGISKEEFLPPNYTLDDLAAKIVSIMRSNSGYNKAIEIKLKQGVVICDGKETPLLAKEIKLLTYFYKHVGDIVTRKELLNEVWGYKSEATTRTLDVHVSRLRLKLGDIGDAYHIIQTVRGIGYKFIAP